MQGTVAFLALSVLLYGLPSGAQSTGDAGVADDVPVEAPQPVAGSRVVEAQQHLHAAMELFRANEYAGALHEFEMANAAAPSPEIWYNIARVHELLHEYEAAVENLQRYLRDKVDPPDRAEVLAHIHELETLAEQQSRARRRLATGATMHVEVSVRDARILVDNQLRGTSPGTLTWPIEPGVHAVEIDAPGRQTWRASVRVHAGEAALVIADPLPMTQYRTIPAGHVASAIVAALGVGAFIVGGVFGVEALATSCDRCSDLTDRSTRADVSFGVGAVLAVGAAIVYFVERGNARTEVVSGQGN